MSDQPVTPRKGLHSAIRINATDEQLNRWLDAVTEDGTVIVSIMAIEAYAQRGKLPVTTQFLVVLRYPDGAM